MLQPRFNRRSGVKSLSLLQHPRFRAAYDFLLLRAQVGVADPELAAWWTNIQVLPQEERVALVQARPQEARRRRPAADRPPAPAQAAARRSVAQLTMTALWRPAYVAIGSNLDRPARAGAGGMRADRHAARDAARAQLPALSHRAHGPAGSARFRERRRRAVDAADARASCSMRCSISSAPWDGFANERWGPRLIDLDLVWMVGAASEGPGLQLPHPGVSMRNFVLYPLDDIAPTLDIPGHGRVRELKLRLETHGISVLE